MIHIECIEDVRNRLQNGIKPFFTLSFSSERERIANADGLVVAGTVIANMAKQNKKGR